MYEVETVEEEERRVFGLPHRGPYAEIGAAFDELSARLAEAELWPEVRELLGVYFGDPRKVHEAALHALAGFTAAPDRALPSGFEETRLPGGRYARMRVKGPYEGLEAAYDWIYETWLPEVGEQERGSPSFEIYVNNPREVAEENLLTDIYVPLA